MIGFVFHVQQNCLPTIKGRTLFKLLLLRRLQLLLQNTHRNTHYNRPTFPLSIFHHATLFVFTYFGQFYKILDSRPYFAKPYGATTYNETICLSDVDFQPNLLDFHSSLF